MAGRARSGIAVAALLSGGLVLHPSGFVRAADAPDPALVQLGSDLFHDSNLSKNRTQACATCHMPDAGFVDRRDLPDTGMAASLGDDGTSIGTRNAPTASYAALSPRFHKNAEGKYVGGQFLDGRAATLEEQAGGPPLNPVEMGMPDKASVAGRLQENPDYQTRFAALFGADIFGDDARAYDAMTRAIAAFERTPDFQPFDSRYDRALRGEIKLTDQEELGRVLFFSNQFTNCNLCHQLKSNGGQEGETFSNYQYHNIGVPANLVLGAVHGAGKPDLGLAENPNVTDKDAQAGKFKVPPLRNVGVTGPYMHNGVFKDLRTVILFYNKYNSIAKRRQINPETSKEWDPPEVAENISLTELETGPALDDKRIDALVAFLKTLTDQRYEALQAEIDAETAANAAGK